MRKLAPLCICILFATGCPEKDSSNGDNGGNNDVVITNANAFDVLLGAWCARLSACESEVGPTFPTVADCKALLYGVFATEGDVDALSWQDTSLYRIDSAKANECLTAIQTLDCSGDPGDVDACNDAIVGLLAEGDCCDERGGCGPDMECVGPVDATGTCQTDAELAETCEYNRSCVEGLYCSHGGGTPVCAAYVAAGEDCSSGQCEPGTFCDSSGMSPTCVAATVDSPCTSDEECQDDAFCDHSSGGSPTCQPYVQLDGACVSSAMAHPCAPGLTCLNDTCQPEPGIGDACNPNYDDCPYWMLDEIACLDTTGGGTYLCTAAALSGEDCGGDAPDCAWTYGLYCSALTDTCATLPGSGDLCLDACWPYDELYCDATYTCAARLVLDDSCSPSSPDDFGGCVLGLECDASSETCVEPSLPICL